MFISTVFQNWFQNYIAVADLRGRVPPWEPKFFQFHAVFGKIWQNHMLAPPPPLGELASPPRGNPGSAAVSRQHM